MLRKASEAPFSGDGGEVGKKVEFFAKGALSRRAQGLRGLSSTTGSSSKRFVVTGRSGRGAIIPRTLAIVMRSSLGILLANFEEFGLYGGAGR